MAARLTCTPVDRARLEHWARTATAPHRLVLRSQIVLLLLDGFSQARAARELGISRETVGRWERRFAIGGADALTRDRPGRGRRPGRNASHVARVLDALDGVPAGTWTTRRLAAHLGISSATVQRIWREALQRRSKSTAQLMIQAAAPPAGDGGGRLATRRPDSVGPFPSTQDADTCR